MGRSIDPFTVSAILAIVAVQLAIWAAHFFVPKCRIPRMDRQKMPSFFMDTATGTATVMFTISLLLTPIAPMLEAQPSEGQAEVKASMITGFVGSAHQANPITLFIIGGYMLISVILQMLKHWDGTVDTGGSDLQA